MASMAVFMILLGVLAYLGGGLFIAIAAFRKSALWGLACLFLPFAALVFVIQNWDDTKVAFLATVGGFVLIFAAVMMLPDKDRERQVARNEQLQASTVPSTPQNYEPPRSAYSPPPAYVPPPQPAPVTTTVVEEKKRTLEMVYIDRNTGTYYTEKCKKKPDNVTRVAKTVALMQGYAPARCGS